MNFKKLMLVAFVLLVILTLGAVSASDTGDNLTAIDDGGDSLSAFETPLDDGGTILSDDLDDDWNGTDFDDDLDDDWNGTDFDDDFDDDLDNEFSYYFDLNTVYMDSDDYEEIVEYWFDDDVTGTVAILLNGVEIYNSTIESGEYVYLYGDDFNFDGLESDWFEYGVHELEFRYSGDENYDGFSDYRNLTVTHSFDAYLDTYNNFDGIAYNESAIFRINMPSEGTGYVRYTVNGKNYTKDFNDDDGYIVTIDTNDIQYGVNNVTFEYIGDDYPLKTVDKSFDALGVVKFDNEIAFNEPLTFTVVLPEDANGELRIYEVTGRWDYDEDEYVTNLTLLTTGNVKNGFGNAVISNLAIGKYKIYAEFSGDYDVVFDTECNDYESEYYDVGFMVTPKITIPKEVWVNGTYYATFDVPYDSGELTVKIGDEQRTFNFENGTVTFELFNLDYEDEYYEPGEDKIFIIRYSCFDYDGYMRITVRMENPNIDLDLDDTEYYRLRVKGQEKYYATLELPYSAGGNVTVYVDDEFYSSEELNFGYVSFDIDTENLSFGKHDVRFEYSGDGYFTPSTAYDYFNVTYIRFGVPSEVTIGENYGSSSTALVLMPSDATGEVKLTIDGVVNATHLIDDGRAMFSLSYLTYGNHTVTLDYQNGNYPSSSQTFDVEARYPYSLAFDDLIYGREDAYVVLPAGATGEVIAVIDGREFRATVDENGIARFNITGLAVGRYIATVSYLGDDKYPSESKSFNLTVKYAIYTNIYEGNLFEGDFDNFIISLTLPENATGSLVIKQESWDYDEEYEIINDISLIDGYVEITLNEALSDMENIYDSFHFIIRYVGDDYEVEDLELYITINGHQVIRPDNYERVGLGDVAEFTVKFANDVNGYLRLYYDGGYENYTLVNDYIYIINGSARFAVDTSQLGRHFYVLEYVGNDYSMENEHIHVVVWPENVTLVDEASEDDVVFSVQMPADASGILTLFIYNEDANDYYNITVPYNGGITDVMASDFSAGISSLQYFYVNDEKYGFFTFTATTKYFADGFYAYFRIIGSPETTLLNPELSVSASDINVGDAATVNIVLNETISGDVLVSVGGANYTVTAVNGRASLTVADLSAGTYNVKAIFAGNEQFKNAVATAAFKVNKLPAPAIVIDALDSVPEGSDLNVRVSISGADGIVYINNKESELFDGVATATIYNVTSGDLLINVVYPGDGRYLNASNSKMVNVYAKLDPGLSVSVSDINYGDDATVNIVLNENINGNVSVSLGGADYTVNAVNGRASLTLTYLPADRYDVKAVFEGNELFLAGEDSASFTVNRVDATLVLSGDTVYDYGSVVVINVEVGGANAAAAIDGNNVAVNDGVISIAGLNAGIHKLTVTAVGDANHNDVVKSINITVNKVDSALSLSGSTKYYSGDVVVINVSYANATGVIAEIDGSNVEVVDGVISIAGLDLGEHYLTVTTVVDENHNAVNETLKVNIYIHIDDLQVDPIVYTYGGAGSTNVSCSGLLYVEAYVIDHTEADVVVNGSVITVSNLGAGQYLLNIRIFTEGGNDEKTVNVTVDKANSTLSVANVAFNYGASGSTNAVYTGATGVTAFVVDHSEAVIKINGNKITLSGLNAGTYTLMVATIADANHTSAVKTATVKVNKLNTALSAAKVITTYGTSKKLVVNLKDINGKQLSGKKISIKLNGKTYNAKTLSNGKATFTVPATLPVKTHKATITFAGDANYNKKTGYVNVIVKKANVKLTAAKKSYAVGTKTKVYNVILKSDKNKAIAKGKVTLRVNGRTYTTTTTSSGIAVFKITNLNKKGTFKANVKFYGNANFNAKAVNTNIIVK